MKLMHIVTFFVVNIFENSFRVYKAHIFDMIFSLNILFGCLSAFANIITFLLLIVRPGFFLGSIDA